MAASLTFQSTCRAKFHDVQLETKVIPLFGADSSRFKALSLIMLVVASLGAGNGLHLNAVHMKSYEITHLIALSRPVSSRTELNPISSGPNHGGSEASSFALAPRPCWLWKDQRLRNMDILALNSSRNSNLLAKVLRAALQRALHKPLHTHHRCLLRQCKAWAQ